MLAERATDRHKAIAQKPVAQAAGPAPGRRCDRKGVNALWKRNGLPCIANMLESVPVLPVAVEQISIAKICDASAPNPAEMREGRRVSALVEHKMQPLAAALHWSAVMRRSQENELATNRFPLKSITP